jgi:DnaJ-class molecular chaperone
MEDDDFYDEFEDDRDCWYCDGSGLVSPTNTRVPAEYLILSTEACPMCDGTGEDFV